MENTQARPFPKFGEILRAGFATFRSNGLLITAVVVGVVSVGQLLAPGAEEFSGDDLSWRVALNAVLWLVISLGQAILISLTMLHVGLCSAKGEKISAGSLFDRTYVTFIPALTVALLIGIGVVLGLLALVVPAFVLMIRWSFATVSAIDGRLGPIAAIRRSSDLVRGRAWRVAGLMGGLFVVNLLVALSFGVLAAVGDLPEFLTLEALNQYLNGFSSGYTSLCIAHAYSMVIALDAPPQASLDAAAGPSAPSWAI